MKTHNLRPFNTLTLFFCFLLTTSMLFSQNQTLQTNNSNFWEKVRFGGGFGLSFGNFTEITVTPAAIYQMSDKFAIGPGLQYSYVSSTDNFRSTFYGASLISLFNPTEFVQLSLELEQLKVNRSVLNVTPNIKDNFWNTALQVGVGYNSGDVVIGGRYNLLFNKENNVYGTAFMPFIRVFF
jgi:hypothetical protein